MFVYFEIQILAKAITIKYILDTILMHRDRGISEFRYRIINISTFSITENIVRIINLPYQHLKRFGYWQLKNMLWKISYFICTVSWLVKKTGEIFFFFRNVFKINPCEQDSNFKRTSSQNKHYVWKFKPNIINLQILS